MMQEIIDRRTVFDLDAKIAARVPADPEFQGAVKEPEPDALLKNADTVVADVIPHEALVSARADRLQVEIAEGRRRRRARDAERVMGAAVDDGGLALQRVPIPAPRPRRRILIKPRLHDPDNRIDANLSRRGNCHDNAVAESFFQLLKRERIRRRTYPTRDAARQDVFEYIEMFYNPKRKHTNNGMLSPIDFEIRQQKLNEAGV
jgi:putative transposase